MNFSRFIVVILLLITLTSVTSFAAAQEQDSPLLDMLTLVPQGQNDPVYFADFAAIPNAYPAAQLPSDWNTYEAWRSEQDRTNAQAFGVWWGVFRGMQSSSHQVFARVDDLEPVMGFDFFQIQRSLLEGNGLEDVYYLEGSFDTDAVRSAYKSRNYAHTLLQGDYQLLCPAPGCYRYSESDPANASVDLFGGIYGHPWSVLISPAHVIGVAGGEKLAGVSMRAIGTIDSLADDPDYQAAAAAVAEQGVLLQAYIPDQHHLLFELSDPPFFEFPPYELVDRSRSLQQLLDNGYTTLPRFDLLMLADVVTETQQVTDVILVYRDEADAQAAATIVPERINQYRLYLGSQLISDALASRFVNSVETHIVRAADRWVVRFEFGADKAEAEEIIALSRPSLRTPQVSTPGSIFQLFHELVWNGEVAWLSIVTREELGRMARIGGMQV